MKRIRVSGPSITAKEVEYVADAAANDWYGNANRFLGRFEAAFAAFVGRQYAISLPSCTSALHISLLAAGVGPGDEVVVPDLTWIATASPISYVGAKPVFADVDSSSWCLDPASFERSITKATKAVIPVDLYGNMPAYDPVLEVAQRHGISVIEDAAEAIGSEYKGKRAGSFGLASAFSFHGSKTMTTGEGGMLVTDDSNVYQRCLFLRDHGRDPGGKMFWNTEVAFKYKMSSLQAALGLAQLERIDELVERKRQIFEWYREELRCVEGLQLNSEAPDVKNTYWMVTIILDPDLGLKKEDVVAQMLSYDIECRPLFYPLSSLPAYNELPQSRTAYLDNPTAYAIGPYGINLPSGLQLERDDIRYVCNTLKSILSESRHLAGGMHH